METDMKKMKWVAAAVAAVMAMGLLAGCSAGAPASSAAPSAGAESAAPDANGGSDKKVLRLGTDAAFPPFEFQEGNDFMGIDIDIGRAVADELGMDFEVVNMDFDSLLGALESGKVDLVAAGMTIRPDREKQADFSDTYYQATQVITVMKDNAEIKGVDDLKNKKIGVQKGTTGEELAREIEGAEVLSFANGQEAGLAMKTGKVDAVLYDAGPSQKMVAQNDDMTIIEDDSFDKEEYAIAVKKGDEDMLKAVNDTLAKLEQSGEMDKIVEKYNN
jgi:ABC-type amino acid transport substrate-binding protein